MIHGDVFRSPPHINAFAAFIGAGAQLFFTVLFLLLAVLVGAFKATRRGALLTAGIMIFAVCGLFGGMIAGRLFKQLTGQTWVWNTVFTALVLPLPLGIVFSIVNSIAWSYNSTAALPLTTILVSEKCI
jgi:MFS family permease